MDMKPMRAASITALVFAGHSLLIPSCVQWNIGKAIRECAETRVGVCPSDAWYVGEASPNASPLRPRTPEQIAQIGLCYDDLIHVAREAEYEADTPLLTVDWILSFSGPTPARAQNVTLTGAYRRVDFRYGKFSGLTTTVGERHEIEGKKKERDDSMADWRSELNARTMGCAEVKRGRWYPLAVVAAAPFDYLIDPALTVLSTPVSVFVQAAALGCHELKRALRNDNPVAKPTPTEP